jgi:hypothetical protein
VLSHISISDNYKKQFTEGDPRFVTEGVTILKKDCNGVNPLIDHGLKGAEIIVAWLRAGLG